MDKSEITTALCGWFSRWCDSENAFTGTSEVRYRCVYVSTQKCVFQTSIMVKQMWNLLSDLKDKTDKAEDNDLVENDAKFQAIANEVVIADNVLNLPSTNAIVDFFRERINHESFGRDTLRNTPRNQSSLLKLKECMIKQGVSALNFWVTLAVESEVVDFLAKRGKGKDLNVEELNHEVPSWRATLIDGYHRCDALIELLEHDVIALQELKLRVFWIRLDDDRPRMRGYVIRT